MCVQSCLRSIMKSVEKGATRGLNNVCMGVWPHACVSADQPVTYQLVSRSGDEAAFTDMVKRCAAVGVDIIVDAVINHMAAGAGVGTAGTRYYGNRTFVDYTQDDLHHYNNDKGHNCEVPCPNLVVISEHASQLRLAHIAFLADHELL
jgi:hypothetical protein